MQAEARGTADAVKAAAGLIEPQDTVIVLNGDLPLISAETIAGLQRRHAGDAASATILTAVLADPSGYGRVVRAPDGTVDRVVETKADADSTAAERAIDEVNTGVVRLLGRGAAGRAGGGAGRQCAGRVLPARRAADHRRHGRTVLAFELADPAETLQINDRVQLAAVRAEAQRRIIERHQLAGATVVEPRATVIDVDVTLAEDVVIAPFTSLHGATGVGPGSTIGPHSTLLDARVGADAKVVHLLRERPVGDRVSVGPFAYLRPGTVLREGSKAGTFVEIKNSDVGARTKVPHLSYIGDADIGEDTNLGASTITANYDGYRKHRTTIGVAGQDERRHDPDRAGRARRRCVHRRRLGDQRGRPARGARDRPRPPAQPRGLLGAPRGGARRRPSADADRPQNDLSARVARDTCRHMSA